MIFMLPEVVGAAGLCNLQSNVRQIVVKSHITADNASHNVSGNLIFVLLTRLLLSSLHATHL